MNILSNIFHFLVNGFSVFHQAYWGKYKESLQEIEDLKREMLATSNCDTDKENLKKDRINISHDVRKIAQKID